MPKPTIAELHSIEIEELEKFDEEIKTKFIEGKNLMFAKFMRKMEIRILMENVDERIMSLSVFDSIISINSKRMYTLEVSEEYKYLKNKS